MSGEVVRWECNRCGCARSHGQFFALSREVAQLLDTAPGLVETEYESDVSIGEWCPACGTEAALRALHAAGIKSREVEDEFEDCIADQLCAVCGLHVVRQRVRHVAYTINHYELTIDEELQHLRSLVYSMVCDGCDAGLRQGEAVAVACKPNGQDEQGKPQ